MSVGRARSGANGLGQTFAVDAIDVPWHRPFGYKVFRG